MRRCRLLPLLTSLVFPLAACGAPPGAHDADPEVDAPNRHVGSSGSGSVGGGSGGSVAAGAGGGVGGSSGWASGGSGGGALAGEDGYEDNDEESKAATLPIGMHSLWLADPDWFRPDLGLCDPVGGYVWVTAYFEPGSRVDLIVKDGAGNERSRTTGKVTSVALQFSLEAVGTDLRIGIQGDKPGAYMLEVWSPCNSGAGGWGSAGGDPGTGGWGSAGGDPGTGGWGSAGGDPGTGGWGSAGGDPGTGGWGSAGGDPGTGGTGGYWTGGAAGWWTGGAGGDWSGGGSGGWAAGAGGDVGWGGSGGWTPTDDAYEPNDTKQAAKPLGSWAYLYSYNPDWFTFHATCQEGAYLQFDGYPNLRDKTIEVTTPTAPVLLHHGPASSIAFELEPDQTHTIGIVGGLPEDGGGEGYNWQATCGVSGSGGSSGAGGSWGGGGGSWGGGGGSWGGSGGGWGSSGQAGAWGGSGQAGAGGASSGGAAGASAGAGGGAGSGAGGGPVGAGGAGGGAAGSGTAGSAGTAGGGVAGAGAGAGGESGGHAGASAGAAGAGAGGPSGTGAGGNAAGTSGGAGATAGTGATAGAGANASAGKAGASTPHDDEGEGQHGGGCSVGSSRSDASLPPFALAALAALGLVLARRRKRAS